MVYALPYKKIIDYEFKPNDLNEIKLLSKNYPVFISSRIKGMEKLRKQIVQELTNYGFDVFGWEVGEKFGTPQKANCRDIYLDFLKKSKIYLGILDKEYGNLLPDLNISATEDEYNYAIKNGLELILCISKNKTKDINLEKLKKSWKANHSIISFNNFKELKSILEDAINRLLLKYSDNWIMVQDAIIKTRYIYKDNKVIVNKKTTKEELVEYFRKLDKNNVLHFIDLDLGFVQFAKLESFNFHKLASTIYEIEIVLDILPNLKKVSWNIWKNYKDLRLSGGFGTVEGEEHLQQYITLCLNVNKGEIPFSNAGSNFYNICKDYSDNSILFELLAKFDIIETITGKIDEKNNEMGINCVEKIKSMSFSNISKNGFDLLISLNIKDREDFTTNIKIKWN